MSKISNRQVVQLKELCERITKGSTPTSYGFDYVSHGIRFIKAENIDEKGIAGSTTDYIEENTNAFLKRSILKADDLLFSIAGTIGRVGLVCNADLPANTNQALAIIRLLPGAISPRYLFYYLKSDATQRAVRKKTVGVGRANVSLANLGEVEVPVVPLDEQQHIVAEIEQQFSRLDEAVASLKRVKANLKRYKAAVLKAAVEGKLTEDWRKQHPAVEPASKLLERILADGLNRSSDIAKDERDVEGDSGSLFKVPKKWVWCKANCLAQILDPQPSHRTPKKVSSGVPYIGMGDVTTNGKIDFLSARKVSKQILEEHRQRYRLEKGNFIFGKIGTLGSPVFLPEPFDYTLSANVVLFQPDSKITNPGFVLDYMRSPFVGTYLARMSKATSQPAFGIQKIREMPIPLPPIEEQNEIVAEAERRISVIEEVETAIEANLTRADRLRQSILSQAFAGGLGKKPSVGARQR